MLLSGSKLRHGRRSRNFIYLYGSYPFNRDSWFDRRCACLIPLFFIVMTKTEEYLRRYLKIAPLCVALWRSVEARHLSTVKLKRPILDIGCGWGEFAEAFGKKIDMGIDIAPKDLYVAAKGGMYKNLTLADASDLPFRENSYGSIFSISTFEHIKDTSKLLKEMYRVLMPGGILAITMETDEVDKNTFYRPFLKNIGLTSLSNGLR